MMKLRIHCLITNPPPISFTSLSENKTKTCDMWHMTWDTWQVTHDMWHMTHDMFGGGGRTFSQNFSSLALTDCNLWYYEDLEEKADSISQWTNDKAVFRTAPTTPGLLIRWLQIIDITPSIFYIGSFRFFLLFNILHYSKALFEREKNARPICSHIFQIIVLYIRF